MGKATQLYCKGIDSERIIDLKYLFDLNYGFYFVCIDSMTIPGSPPSQINNQTKYLSLP